MLLALLSIPGAHPIPNTLAFLLTSGSRLSLCSTFFLYLLSLVNSALILLAFAAILMILLLRPLNLLSHLENLSEFLLLIFLSLIARHPASMPTRIATFILMPLRSA
jgi:hypothetical protein